MKRSIITFHSQRLFKACSRSPFWAHSLHNWCQNFLKKLGPKSCEDNSLSLPNYYGPNLCYYSVIRNWWSFVQHNWQHLLPDFMHIFSGPLNSTLYIDLMFRTDDDTEWISFYPYDPCNPWLIHPLTTSKLTCINVSHLHKCSIM